MFRTILLCDGFGKKKSSGINDTKPPIARGFCGTGPYVNSIRKIAVIEGCEGSGTIRIMDGEENKHNKPSWWCCGCHTKRSSLLWGVFLLIIGGYFLAQEFGYVSYDGSIWPIFLIAFDLYLVGRGVMK